MVNDPLEFFTHLVEQVVQKTLSEEQALTELEKLAKTNKERIKTKEAFKKITKILDQKSLEIQQLKEDFYTENYMGLPEKNGSFYHTGILSPLLSIPVSMYEKLHLWCYTQFRNGVHFNKVYWTLRNSFDLCHSLALYFTQEGLNTYQITMLNFSAENIEKLKQVIFYLEQEQQKQLEKDRYTKN